MIGGAKRKAKPPADENVITVEQAQALEAIPAEHRTGLRALGGNWFKDDISGVCYRLALAEGTLQVAETRQSIKKEHKATRTNITCVDCGVTREVATQDAFQVKRCVPCQTIFVKTRRAERAKARRAKLKATTQPPVETTVN